MDDEPERGRDPPRERVHVLERRKAREQEERREADRRFDRAVDAERTRRRAAAEERPDRERADRHAAHRRGERDRGPERGHPERERGVQLPDHLPRQRRSAARGDDGVDREALGPAAARMRAASRGLARPDGDHGVHQPGAYGPPADVSSQNPVTGTRGLTPRGPCRIA